MIIHNCDQGTHEWLQLRLGKITGTRLKKMLAKDNLALLDELIAEEETGLSDDDDFVSEEMQRGIDLEPLAIQEYSNITGHEVDHPCLIQSSEWPILMMSPDGYIGTTGAVEIKCPKTKTHIKYIRQGKIPNDYKEQIWAYFMVNPDLQWLDFVSYDPRLTKKPIWILHITREEVAEELLAVASELDKFINKLNSYRNEIFF
jgi:putative phage-type endonuclease